MDGFFGGLRARAVKYFETPDPNKTKYNRKLSRDEKFRHIFRIPSPETIVAQIAVVVAIPVSPQQKQQRQASNGQNRNRSVSINKSYDSFEGQLYLTESFLAFTSASDMRSLNFAIPLACVRSLKRLAIQPQQFTLEAMFLDDLLLVFHLSSMLSQCEQFNKCFTTLLRNNAPRSTAAKRLSASFYSEYLFKASEHRLAEDQHSIMETDQHLTKAPEGGLGLQYGFPGDAKLLKDASKTRLWNEYFTMYGRNLAIVKLQRFYKLSRVGLPNKLRGELWEICSGAAFLHYQSPNKYKELLEMYEHKQSLAVHEIEKDLKRSLPEYVAYQNDEGIDRLRRVLTMYSWMNPEVGYCQAMNIVAAALLIFQTEEQAFWTLNVLCNEMLPGYYSKTMYGTLLDQKVLSKLLETTMPILSDHLKACDVPLNVVLLPWFLSLFLNTMSLVHACRVMDLFFVEGAKALFKIALAILKINGEELLAAEDNTSVITILKEYFETLNDAYPRSTPSSKNKSLTKFSQLLAIAFNEFRGIDDELIQHHRAKMEASVLDDVEDFAKRTQIRNLPKPKNLSLTELGIIYDKFYVALQDERPCFGGKTSDLNYEQFITFMSSIMDWMHPKFASRETLSEHKYVKRLFDAWDRRQTLGLSLADVVQGLDKFVEPDLLENLNNFFALYESSPGTQTIHKSLLVDITAAILLMMHPWCQNDMLVDDKSKATLATYSEEQRRDPELQAELKQMQSTRYLGSVSALLQKFPEATVVSAPSTTDDANRLIDFDSSENVYVPFSSLRMLILCDETLEEFFSKTIHRTTHLTEEGTGLYKKGPISISAIMSGLVNDGMRVAGEIRKKIDELDDEDDEPEDMTVKASDRALLIDL